LEEFVDELRARHLPKARRSGMDAWRRAIDHARALEPLKRIEVMHERRLDRDAFAAYIASLSFISGLPDAQRRAVLDEVRRLAPAECMLIMRCECFWTRERSQY
jgi:hypothetical protein